MRLVAAALLSLALIPGAALAISGGGSGHKHKVKVHVPGDGDSACNRDVFPHLADPQCPGKSSPSPSPSPSPRR